MATNMKCEEYKRLKEHWRFTIRVNQLSTSELGRRSIRMAYRKMQIHVENCELCRGKNE